MNSGNKPGGERVADLQDLLSEVYGAMEGSEVAMAFSERHNINSAAVLTVIDDEAAATIAEYLAPRIEGKTVVEIGGGIGLLSLHMARLARRVYCIEANPMWSWTFAQVLLQSKPKNASFLFGSADEFVGCIKADIAIVCTHSDVQGMKLVAQQFAPVVVDVYGEVIEANPAAFDPFAREARNFV
jgi:predicted RNA methylase